MQIISQATLKSRQYNDCACSQADTKIISQLDSNNCQYNDCACSQAEVELVGTHE